VWWCVRSGGGGGGGGGGGVVCVRVAVLAGRVVGWRGGIQKISGWDERGHIETE